MKSSMSSFGIIVLELSDDPCEKLVRRIFFQNSRSLCGKFVLRGSGGGAPEKKEYLKANVFDFAFQITKFTKETRKFPPPARSIFIDDENSITLQLCEASAHNRGTVHNS